MSQAEEGAVVAQPLTEQPLTEEEAARRCQAGQDDPAHSAFRVLYDRHAAEVFRFQRKLLGDRQAAEDATQETFLRLHRGLKGFDPSRPLRPYVLQVARNVAIDVLRVRMKRPRPEMLGDEGPASPDGAVPASASEEERKVAIAHALEALPPEHRAILVLRFMHGLKLEEIADAQACTTRTTRNRLRAAAVLLERELRRRGIASPEDES